jgi:hypothetical protein
MVRTIVATWALLAAVASDGGEQPKHLDATATPPPRIVKLEVGMPGIQETPVTLHLLENEAGLIRLFDRDLAVALVASVVDEAAGDVTFRAHRLVDRLGEFHYREAAGETLHARVGFTEYLREGGVFTLKVVEIAEAPAALDQAALGCRPGGSGLDSPILGPRPRCCITSAPSGDRASLADGGSLFGGCGCLVISGGSVCCSGPCCP